ncbi:MAG: dihydroxyacetone kinase subunit L [Eubacterium sp.]|nr:dihydroxyacetone kinase subunit L [Eubacterium sp.]
MEQRISLTESKEMLFAVCDKLIENKPYLTRLDGRIGDGDHGIGMRRGARAAREAMAADPPAQTVNELFRRMGQAMLSSMGGASGVVFGTFFLGAAKGCPDTDSIGGAELTDMIESGLEKVMKRGKAVEGDKTMVDALAPAVRAMKACPDDDPAEVTKAACPAAGRGAEMTMQMTARHGHARTLGERSLGHMDPGAASVCLIFEAMHEYLSGIKTGQDM